MVRAVVAERVARDRPDHGHQAERDRQVVVAALLGEIGGREVDGDPPAAPTPRRSAPSTPLQRLGDRLFRQADHRNCNIFNDK